MQRHDLLPWADRTGRFSALRAVTFAAVVLPSADIALALASGHLAAEPFKEATHLTGEWALYFLLASLAVSPLRRLLAWPRLVGIRRMLGLAAFGYAVAHVALFFVDKGALMAASEIVSRFYLAIGFIAVLGLAVLAATSFDAAIRRLGGDWQRLHRIVYMLTALGLFHYFLQSKIDVSAPVLLTGLFVALMLHRALRRLPVPRDGILGVLLVAVAAGIAAALVEAGWYAATTGVDAGRVLASNLDVSYAVRPMWWVMGIAAAPAPFMIPAVSRLWAQIRTRAPAPRPALSRR
jgi:sulfoxide reductase heme-binding subunit YedZ